MSIPIEVAHYICLPFKEHGHNRFGIDCRGLSSYRQSYEREFARHLELV